MQRRDVNAECEVNKTQNCWLRGRTPIFLSFHSTVSCRSDISLTKPSCFKRSWRISWTTAKGNKVWEVEREQKEKGNSCIYTVCGKRKLWNATCSLFKWQTDWKAAVFLTSAFFFKPQEAPFLHHTLKDTQILTFSSSSLCFSVSFISLNWNWSTLWACFSRSNSCEEQETAWQPRTLQESYFQHSVPSVVILGTVRPI